MGAPAGTPPDGAGVDRIGRLRRVAARSRGPGGGEEVLGPAQLGSRVVPRGGVAGLAARRGSGGSPAAGAGWWRVWVAGASLARFRKRAMRQRR